VAGDAEREGGGLTPEVAIDQVMQGPEKPASTGYIGVFAVGLNPSDKHHDTVQIARQRAKDFGADHIHNLRFLLDGNVGLGRSAEDRLSCRPAGDI
jgi:hypothetical protein